MQKTTKIILLSLAVLAVLVLAFFLGGSPAKQAPTLPLTAEEDRLSEAAPGTLPERTPTEMQTETDQPDVDPAETDEEADAPDKTDEPEETDAAEPQENGKETAKPSSPAASDSEMTIDPATGKDAYQTDPVPEGKPAPVEPENVQISDAAHTCTLSISCATLLVNLDLLDPEKKELVPENGVILPATQVTFYEGESVFNVLQRTCKQQGIHMEFVNTPIYNSAYIEGIHNLYEFDAGDLSGWMYRVNGWFPNYGCSRYALQPGDVIEWVYTCDLGQDVGGGYAAGGREP